MINIYTLILCGNVTYSKPANLLSSEVPLQGISFYGPDDMNPLAAVTRVRIFLAESVKICKVTQHFSDLISVPSEVST